MDPANIMPPSHQEDLTAQLAPYLAAMAQRDQDLQSPEVSPQYKITLADAFTMAAQALADKPHGLAAFGLLVGLFRNHQTSELYKKTLLAENKRLNEELLRLADVLRETGNTALAAYQSAREKATTDALTGLANKSFTLARLEETHEQTRSKSGYGILFLDLNGFKGVNDNLGHATGDNVLREVGKILRSVVRRNGDFIGRLGGDEFVVIIEDSSDPKKLAAIAEKIRIAIEEGINLPQLLDTSDATEDPKKIGVSQKLRISSSIGAATENTGTKTWKEVLGDADSRMYQAKKARKRGEPNRICLSDNGKVFKYVDDALVEWPKETGWRAAATDLLRRIIPGRDNNKKRPTLPTPKPH
jgi:diguanylate cyclase (GGDEF)-like protein